MVRGSSMKECEFVGETSLSGIDIYEAIYEYEEGSTPQEYVEESLLGV